MAIIVYKQVWTYVGPGYDQDAQLNYEDWAADTWRFDTTTRTTSYLPYPEGGTRRVFPGYDDQPQDISLVEVWAECLKNTTTRRAYIHDGVGGVSPQDDPNSTECGFGALTLERLTPYDPLPGQTTGRVQVDVAGGLGVVKAQVTGQDPFTLQTIDLDASGLGEISNLPPQSYELYVFDSSFPPQAFTRTFTISAARVPGCTDPKASNYNQDATFDDGTCQYTPTVRAGVFRVPRLNPVRFVVEEGVDGVNRFASLDNTLFCQQERPGQQLRPLYRQPVQRGDMVRLQVHTDYSGGITLEIRHTDGGVVRTVPGELAQQLLGLGEPMAVVLSAHLGSGGGTRLQLANGQALPTMLRRAERVVLSGGGIEGTYRVRQLLTLEDGTPALLLNRPWTEAPTGPVQAQWDRSTVNFNVWEVETDFTGVANGTYTLHLRATDAAAPDAVAVSEPVWVAGRHPNTVVVDYGNRDNAYGVVWSTGLLGRLRLPGTFFRRAPAGSSSVHRSSSGQATLLSSTAQRRVVLETAGLPDWLHEKLFVVFRLDLLQVNGQRVVVEGDYEPQELRTFPLYGGSVTVELFAGFGTGNGDDTGSDLPASSDNLLELRRGGFLKLH